METVTYTTKTGKTFTRRKTRRRTMEQIRHATVDAKIKATEDQLARLNSEAVRALEELRETRTLATALQASSKLLKIKEEIRIREADMRSFRRERF